MTNWGRAVRALAVIAVALALPAAAAAHAYLIKTVPEASAQVNSSPPVVALTYDEAVEPKFALISVTDTAAHQETTGPVRRSASNPNTLEVPLRHLAEGWYLVYWRAISVDGHPVRGFFTFRVGPNPGPAPQFVIPSISETAATPRLVAARWIVFLAIMAAIGLFVLRIAILRPVVRRVEGTSLRAVTVAFAVAAGVGLAALPIYLLLATAEFALRSVFDVGTLVSLTRVTAFGRGYVDLEICFALFVAAAAVALWVDRPDRQTRSTAELLATTGAFAAAAAVFVVPGAAGHAAQTSPRGLSLALDSLHLISGSLWLGGLIGLLVFWRSLPAARRVGALIVAVPRFSNVAFVSVVVLLATGTWATVLHMPLLAALWETSYGQTVIVKIALLAAAVLLAAVNLVRTKPRLAAARNRPELGQSAARLLRQLVSGEAVFVTAAVLAAAVLSSLPPPAKALAQEGKAIARVGPGVVVKVAHQGAYTLRLGVTPNKAAAQNSFSLEVTKGGVPVSGGDVTVSFLMLDMEMGQQTYRLSETKPGLYTHDAPALVMVGHWGLSFDVTPKNGQPFNALFIDHAVG